MPGLAGEVANLIVALKLDDSGFTGKINNVARTLGRMDAGLHRMGRGVGQLGSGLSKLGTVAFAAAAGGLTAVVATAVSFEDAFAGVRKTVDATDAQLDALQETFRRMAREIPLSFESFAAIGEQAGALGIAAADIEEFTRVAALIGVTTDVSADQAATSLGVLSNVLHLTSQDYDNFGATLVDLGNKGASTESAILAIAERAGAGASLIGIASDATLGWSSSIANLGIEVEAGGTALQKFFLESLRNIQDDKTLELMAETAGVTGKAFKQAFEKDASKALQTFVIGLGKLENAERLAVLEGLGFSDIRITRALLGLAGDTDGLTSSLTIAGKAWKDNTALTVEAEKRFKTTASQIQKLKNNLRDVAFTIGAELLPVTNDLITDFVNEVNKPGTQAGIRAFAKDLAAGVRGLVAELRGTDFSGLLAGMKFAADAAKVAFDAFRSLPAPLQTAIVGLVALNKVSGGGISLLVKGIGNIAFGGLTGGLAGIFGGRGKTPLNPLFVSVVGGLPGGGVAGGAGAGRGGLVAGAIGTAGAAAVVTGGILSIQDITSGTKQGVIQGVLAQGIGGLVARALQDPIDDLIAALGLNTDALGSFTPLGQFDPRNPGGTPTAVQRVMGFTAGALLPTKLPNTAADAGGGVIVKLPSTAMSALRETPRAVTRLAPILSRVERASQSVAQRISDSKFATMQGLSAVRGAVDRIKVSPRVNVNATIINNVQVNANRVVSQITRARVATGTIPEFA